MSSSRMAPLWRSSGRCLALRPRATATKAPLPRAVAVSVATTRPVLASQRTAAVFPAAVRGYADNATTQGGGDELASTTQHTEAALLHTQQSIEQIVEENEAVDKSEMSSENRAAIRQLELMAQGLAPFDPAVDGHKFGLTTAMTRASTAQPLIEGEEGAEGDLLADGLDLPLVRKVQERYDPVTAQLTRLLMRDGKLAKAQRDMAVILNYLRTSPPPKLNPARPLLPGHPPAAQLPLDPVRYLALAVDSVAPLIKIKSLTGQAGGGRALPVPMPLLERQRRRTAFVWLLDVVSKKQSRGSGRNMFAHRVAEEVVAVVEGRSSLWDKRQLLHKQGTTARINVNALTQRRKKM